MSSSSVRAQKSGIGFSLQKKIEANYDPEEAVKCLFWMRLVTGCEEIPNNPDEIDGSSDNFYNTLKDGMVLSSLMDTINPGNLDWNSKTFQEAKINAMQLMRERERIAIFTKLCIEFGVPETNTFPTESLHERGALNLAQVCACLRSLGIQAQSKPDYPGPEGYWPHKAEKQERHFSEEQLKAGQNVIGLQMGTNKGANAAGMTMGKQRMIVD